MRYFVLTRPTTDSSRAPLAQGCSTCLGAWLSIHKKINKNAINVFITSKHSLNHPRFDKITLNVRLGCKCFYNRNTLAYH